MIRHGVAARILRHRSRDFCLIWPRFARPIDFAAALTAAGKPVRLVVAQSCNHFEVNETLASPYGFFGRAVLEQMKLRPA